MSVLAGLAVTCHCVCVLDELVLGDLLTLVRLLQQVPQELLDKVNRV